MNIDWKKIAYVAGGILVLLALGWLLYSFFFGGSAPVVTAPPSGGSFGAGGTITPGNAAVGNGGSTPIDETPLGSSQQKIFKIAGGPVVSAAFIETTHPTTTIVRYTTAVDGHVLDQQIDAPGTPARGISNSTVPGVAQALWTEGGRGVIYQYLDAGTVKSVHLSLPIATTSPQTASSSLASAIAFSSLPQNMLSLAVSPDGTKIAYLLSAAGGATGYIAKPDGSSPAQLFSLPLAQMVLTWPAAGELIAYQKSAVGVPGIALSINTKTGAVSQMLYGQGLTVLGNPAFTYALYQTADGVSTGSYIQQVGKSISTLLSQSAGSPFPEQCAWASETSLYCAAPRQTVSGSFLDLWHRGEARADDQIVHIDAGAGTNSVVGLPGGTDGGEASDIIDLTASPSGRYLLFVNKDDRSLWGVRL